MENVGQYLIQLGGLGICLYWFMIEQRKYNEQMISKMERITAFFAASQPPEVAAKVESLLGD